MKRQDGKMNNAVLVIVPLFLIVVTLISMLFFQRSAVERSQTRAYRTLEESASNQIATIRAEIGGQYAVLESFANSLSVQDDIDDEHLETRMEAIARITDFMSVIKIDRDGRAVLSDGRDIQMEDQTYFQEAMKGSRAIAKVSSSPFGDADFFVIAVPVFKGRDVVAAIAGFYEEKVFRSLLISKTNTQGAYSFISDSKGDIIVSSDSEGYLAKEKNLFEFFKTAEFTRGSYEEIKQEITELKSGTVIYSVGDQTRCGVYRQTGIEDWVMFNIVPGEVVDADARTAARDGLHQTAWISAISLLLLALIVVNERRHSKQLALYRTMEESGVFSAIVNREFTLLYGNDKFYAIIECTRESMAEKFDNKFMHMVHSNDAAMIQETTENIIREGGGYAQFVVRIVVGSGNNKYLLVSGNIEKQSDNLIMSGVIVDITEQKQIELELRVQKQITDIALADTTLNVWEYDYETQKIIQAENSTKWLKNGRELANAPASLIESGCIHPESVNELLEMHELLLAGEAKVSAILRVKKEDGTGYCYELVRYTNVLDDRGRPCRAVGMSEDVTSEHELEMKYQTEQQYRVAMEPSFYSTALFNVTTRVQVDMHFKNPEDKQKFSGLSIEEFAQLSKQSVVDNEDVKKYFASFSPEMLEKRAEVNAEPVIFDFIKAISSGETRWMHYEAHLLRDPESGDLMAFLYMTDIDDQKRKEYKLEAAAERDSMTKLYNHDSTISHISRFMKMEGSTGNHALFAVDLDNFKLINDTFGHQQGDKFLIRVAEVFSRIFRSSDIVGRVGGDEFMVLMKNIASVGQVASKAEELVHALQFSCASNSVTLQLSASVGIAIFRHGDKTFEELYSQADSSLYQVKSGSKNSYSISNNLHVEPQEALSLTSFTSDSASTVQLNALLEYMEGGVMLAEVSDSLRIIYVSPGFFKSTGRKKEDARESGEGLFDFVYAEDREKLEQQVKEISCSGDVLDFTYRVKEPNESLSWRHLRAVRIPYERSNYPVVIGVVTDITEQKNVLEQMDAIIQNSPVGIGVCEAGEKLHLTFANDELIKMSGLSREEYEARYASDMYKIIYPEDSEMLCGNLAEAAEKRVSVQSTFRSATMIDGVRRSYLVRTVYMHRSKEGTPVFLSTVMDVTQTLELRKKLADGNERLRYAFEQTDATIWEFDINTRIFAVWDTVNQKYDESATFENAPESLAHNGWVHPEYREPFIEFFNGILSGKEKGSEDFIVRYFGSGMFGWATLSYHMVYDADGKPHKAIGVTHELPNIFNEKSRFIQEERMQEAVKNNVIATMRVNISHKVMECAHIRGTAERVRVGESYLENLEHEGKAIFGEADLARFKKKMSPEALFSAYQSGCGIVEVEYRRTMNEGEIRWVSNTVSLMTDSASGDIYGFGYLRDIDTRKYWELALPSHPERDATTMLFTKKTMERLAKCVIESSGDEYCALALIELQGLDVAFDQSGPDVESRLIYSVACLFLNVLGEIGMIGRDSEHRFSVFVPHAKTQKEVVDIISRAVIDIRRIREIIGMSEELAFSVGIAAERCENLDFDALFQSALAACKKDVQEAHGRVTVYSNDNNGSGFQAVLQTEVKHEDKPSRSLIDDRTGLINRQGYYRMLQNIKTDALFAVGAMFVDINGLNRLNHDYGNEYGDRLISFIAGVLNKTFSGAKVFRVSGDEFIAMQCGITQDEFISLCNEAIAAWDAAYPRNVCAGYTWDVNVSSVQKIIDHAQELMQVSKEEVRRQSGSPSDGVYNQFRDWLMDAIEQKKLKVYLQPQADVNTCAAVSCEALVRYEDPQKGLVSPLDFIPQLERENLIKHLDFYMLTEIFRMLRKYKDAGRRLIPVSVNISRKTLLDPSALAKVKEIQQGYDDVLMYVGLEITESVGSIERATVVFACEQFRQAGFRLSLDDFGSEYSSLYVLSALRFDEIKIDKSVIDDVTINRVSRLIIESVTHICAETGMLCIAEGVETEEQRAVLSSLGCNLIQGYLVDKPLPEKEFVERYLGDCEPEKA
ncbi:MAG: diguanylate cyclase [Oscillospiraceae bacterium]